MKYKCNDCGKEFVGKYAFEDAYEHLNSTDGMGDDECLSFREILEEFEAERR